VLLVLLLALSFWQNRKGAELAPNLPVGAQLGLVQIEVLVGKCLLAKVLALYRHLGQVLDLEV
jgi:hypothetical protein